MQSNSLRVEPVALVYAALVFEYVSLQKLAPAMRLVSPSELVDCAVATGFTAEDGEVITLPSGKSFWSQRFRA